MKSCSSRCISFWDNSSASLSKNSFVKGQNLQHPLPLGGDVLPRWRSLKVMMFKKRSGYLRAFYEELYFSDVLNLFTYLKVQLLRGNWIGTNVKWIEFIKSLFRSESLNESKNSNRAVKVAKNACYLSILHIFAQIVWYNTLVSNLIIFISRQIIIRFIWILDKNICFRK